MPPAPTASALAHAALGADERARIELQLSVPFEPGLASALRGVLESITLRARHWLRDTDLEAHAQSLAVWAREEDLPLAELKALDVIAYASKVVEPSLVTRAEELSQLVDQPVGNAILAHIRSLSRHAIEDSDIDERLLSELGMWMPLPPAEQLTGREREIALYTSLGYPSKFIADRLHLSARTIETHLAHVYAKLGIAGREELRRWFSQDRFSNHL